MGLRQIGSLWRGKKGSKAVLNGSLELEGKEGPKRKVFIFPNEDKTPGSKQPDYRVCEADDDEQRPARNESRDDFQVSDDDVAF